MFCALQTAVMAVAAGVLMLALSHTLCSRSPWVHAVSRTWAQLVRAWHATWGRPHFRFRIRLRGKAAASAMAPASVSPASTRLRAAGIASGGRTAGRRGRAGAG